MTGGNCSTNDRRYRRSTDHSNGVTHHGHPTLLRRPDVKKDTARIGNRCAAEKSCEKAREQDGLNVLGCTRRERENGSDEVGLDGSISEMRMRGTTKRVEATATLTARTAALRP